jgi:hypothetical protein
MSPIDHLFCVFDRQAQFVPTANDSFIFQSPLYCHGVLPVNEAIATRYYFRYTPDANRLSPLLRTLSATARRIERYYFVGVSPSLQPLRHYFCLDESISVIVSLALSDSPILSSIFSRLFRKIAHGQQSIDLDQIFRCAFPTRAILAASLETRSLSPGDLNALFCDLLTNAHTRDEALPRIRALLPLCRAPPGDARYRGVQTLCRVPPPPELPTDLPPPSARFVPLLRAFMAFCQSSDERAQFLEQLRAPRGDALRALLQFVFLATKTTRAFRGGTKIDYTAIDWLCFGLSKVADKGALEGALVQAIQAIAANAVVTYPLSLFRLLHGLLNTAIFSVGVLVDFIESLGPAHCPTFACCWLQLCCHRAVFPRLVRLNQERAAAFCVRYVRVCVELCKIAPDVFYRAVARVLMTIAAAAPFFFVSYHALLLADLPPRFMQFRNVILAAALPPCDAPPPRGFGLGGGAREIAAAWDGSAEGVGRLHGALARAGSRVLIWKFVVAVLEEPRSAPDVFLAVAGFALPLFEPVATALVDQLRYENSHTRAALRIIAVLFERAPARRDVILTEIWRRILCVTPPPFAVFQLQEQLEARFGDAIADGLRHRRAFDLYTRARAAACAAISQPGMRLPV